MKKIILSMFLMLAALTGRGQYNSAVMQGVDPMGIDYTMSLVKEWNDSMVVVLAHDGSSPCFLLVNHSQFVASFSSAGPTYYPVVASLPDSLPFIGGFYVTDFSIVDSTLMFCAVLRSGKGMIGWLNLSDLLLFPPFVDIQYVTTNLEMKFQKILSYKDFLGKIHVAATALDSSSVQNLVYISNITSLSTTGFQYRDLSNSIGGAEYYDELLLVDDNVVLVGTKQLGSNNVLCMRYGIKSRFADSVRTAIYTSPIAVQEVNAHTTATAVDNSRIDVAYMHASSSPTTFAVKNHLFSIGSSQISTLRSQKMYIDNKYDPIALAYLKDDESVVLLQEYHDGMTGYNKFFHLYPTRDNMYPARYWFLKGDEYVSVASFANNRFTAVNGPMMYQQYANAPISTTLCPNESQRRVFIIPEIGIQRLNVSFPWYTGSISHNRHRARIVHTEMQSTCFERQ